MWVDKRDTYRQHWLHGADKTWPQSNCSVDLWIEMLNGWGFQPEAALAFCITQDFEGDQFTFFKFPTRDTELLFGTQLQELSIYDNLEKHVSTQIAKGNVVLVEVDGYYLPDTAGVSYQIKHTKTTIGIDTIDNDNRRLGYYHNDIYGMLDGENYEEVLYLRPKSTGVLFPYTEFVKKLIGAKHPSELSKYSYDLLQDYFGKLPPRNPFLVFGEVFAEQISLLTPETFHEYAFNNFRMFGSNFELLGNFFKWLNSERYEQAIHSCKIISDTAKVLQFRTARMVNKRRVDPCVEIFDSLMDSYYKMVSSASS